MQWAFLGGSVLRSVLSRRPKKGLTRRHFEGRSTPFREHDPLRIRPMNPSKAEARHCSQQSLFFSRHSMGDPGCISPVAGCLDDISSLHSYIERAHTHTRGHSGGNPKAARVLTRSSITMSGNDNMTLKMVSAVSAFTLCSCRESRVEVMISGAPETPPERMNPVR